MLLDGTAMNVVATQFELCLPAWLRESVAKSVPTLSSVEDRMRYVVGLAQRNVEQNTGGPFGAAVFDLDSKTLASVGVNLVVSSGLSIAHAEIMALSLYQRNCHTFDLSKQRLQLVTSAEPCSMCLGAIHWAGVRSIVCAARDSDVRDIGFDEGHKPQNWADDFAQKGMEVLCDVEREAAIQVLRQYQSRGGQIYNSDAVN
jgi:tRNA(Arg) A34 adenosine deaminase TadA